MAAIPLPSIVVALGQTRTSPERAIPAGVTGARIEIDRSAWLPGTRVSFVIEIARDGVTFDWPVVRCEAIAGSDGDIVDLGFDIRGSDPEGWQVRASVSVLEGSPISLAGSIYVDGTRPPKRVGPV